MMQTVHYFGGLDLGQTSDYSAFIVLERTLLEMKPGRMGQPSQPVFHFGVRHMQRWPLGSSYVKIVADVAALYAEAPLKGTLLAVDQTGVGRACVDLLRDAPTIKRLCPITITPGRSISHDGSEWHVAKVHLVSTIKVLFQSKRINVAPTLPDAQTLISEMKTFEEKLTPAANEVYSARQGAHDDLVLAVAIGCWVGSRVGYIDEGGVPYVHHTGAPRQYGMPAWYRQSR